MSLRFILGRAGAGKTQTCMNMIRDALEAPGASPIIYLVPEQATFQAERALLSSGRAAMVRVQVLSFRRLAWRVLGEVGGAVRPQLGELGRRMALRGLIFRRDRELRVFHRAARRSGFIHRLAMTLAELGQHGITPAQLSGQLERLRESGRGSEVLALKVSDLALIYQDYLAYLEGRFTDPDGVLLLAARAIPDSRWLVGAQVWVDGFTGFDPQEYRVLSALMSRAARVHVALCLDDEAPGRFADGLFLPTRQTRDRLEQLARSEGISLEPALGLPPALPRFSASPVLAHLERWLFALPVQMCPVSPSEQLALAAASNRRAEVEAAARQLVALARDRGYRWREMAVIVRDLEAYAELVATVLGGYGIPHFVDRRRPVPHHPLVELVRSALEVVTTGWAYEPVFRVLKTDLAGLSRDEVDQLENYVLAFGIRGRRWLEGGPWRYHRPFVLGEDRVPSQRDAYHLAYINRLRGKAARPLARLQRALRAAASVREVAVAVHDLLEGLGVAAQLEEWQRQAGTSGQPEAAQEHAQVYSGVLELLDQLVEAMGQDQLPLDELYQVMASGLESLTLGMVPPGLDQVVIGTVERSRHPELKAALVLGVGDAEFPRGRGEDVIFTDREREELGEAGLELAPTAYRRQLDEEYLAYVAFTRAGCFLHLSYPLADEGGRPLSPSPYLTRLQRMLPALRLTRSGGEVAGATGGDLPELTGPQQALGLLARRLATARKTGALDVTWVEVYRWLLGRPERRGQLQHVLGSVFHAHAAPPLPPDLVEQLYGNPVRTSVSRLERFASCPLWHFFGSGLGLKPRQVQTVDAPGTGAFFHACLKVFARRLQEQGKDWAELSRPEAAELMRAIVSQLAPALEGEVLLSTAHYRHLAKTMERALLRAVMVMTEHARRSRFRPAAVELEFGRAGLPPLVLDLGAGWRMELHGQIDRVDVAESGGELFLRVVDYKTGTARLALDEVYHGTALQLLTYLLVAQESAPQFLTRAARSAALFYMALREPMISAAGPLPTEKVEQEIRNRFRLSGLVLADARVWRLMDDTLVPGAQSEVVPLSLNQDGSPSQRSRVVDEERLDLLLRFVRHRIRSLGQCMVRGEVGPHPIRRGTRRACQLCEYSAVCGFDILIPGNTYRELRPGSDAEVWPSLEAELRAGGEAGESSPRT